MQWHWIGRIRNRDLARPSTGEHAWSGCKELYSKANKHAKDLGNFDYVRSNTVQCRFVLIKHRPKGRHRTNLAGKKSCNASSLKSASSQVEPWLLAVSPSLDALTATQVVELYSGRMQIEQTFRDLKNPRWGMGLSRTQTRCRKRLTILLVIGALAMYALWLIGLAARAAGYRIEYGSKKKAAQTLSIISLARWWLQEQARTHSIIRYQMRRALDELRSLIINI